MIRTTRLFCTQGPRGQAQPRYTQITGDALCAHRNNLCEPRRQNLSTDRPTSRAGATIGGADA